MKDRILKELDRLQGELQKGQEQREALVYKIRKTETQLVFIQGAIHAMKRLTEEITDASVEAEDDEE
jgi:predicted  nucleic acid-binding Zn-ribbon protein